MCLSVLCVGVCAMCLFYVCGDQKSSQIPWDLSLTGAKDHCKLPCVWWERACVLCKSSQCRWPLSHLSSPYYHLQRCANCNMKSRTIAQGPLMIPLLWCSFLFPSKLSPPLKVHSLVCGPVLCYHAWGDFRISLWLHLPVVEQSFTLWTCVTLIGLIKI